MRRNPVMMIAAAAALLAGCSDGGNGNVGGVTPDEAAQLNDAAEMLDASADGLAAPEGDVADVESSSGNSADPGNAL
jgi:hypothetical protein